MDEQRDRLRQVLKKLAFAKNEKGARGGLLHDISAKGAGLNFVNPMGSVDHAFEVDDMVEVIIDGFPPLNGRVVRTKQEGIFVAFDLDSEAEKSLIADIMIATNQLALDNESRPLA
ncbi:PilZ domain-containing protein [Gimesia sp.]|uniref:PilZ domain-containing protein n=1 Tax=Gimesia sp. TaxID=2024833 RepID=UPI003A8FA4BB